MPSDSSRHKFAIVGYTASRSEAPWGDPDWEVAGCNNLHMFVPEAAQATHWFDLHTAATIGTDAAHTKWLTETDIPVYMWEPAPEWKSALVYPRQEVLHAFSAFTGGRYFTNSISWMVAFAMWNILEAGDGQAPDDAEIGIYGVDMAQGSEYAAQRPSCEYWIGLAEGLGISVTVPDTSDLLKCAFLYGADAAADSLLLKLESRDLELDEKFNQFEAEKQQHIARMNEIVAIQNQVVGAKETGNYIRGVWMQPRGTRAGADPLATTAESPNAEVTDGG